MTEYIFYVPEENELIGDVYYPDERDKPMPVEPLVRCKDCIRSKPSEYWEGLYDCGFVQVSMPPDAFCSMGERREA